MFFFDALWDTLGTAGTEDDDIVTRLWTKNLPTLSIVTADEVMKISELDDILTPQGKAPVDSSLREIVITSYSIHYTKLYDDGKQASGNGGRITRQEGCAFRAIRHVITSYSIHYTKLYERKWSA